MSGPITVVGLVLLVRHRTRAIINAALVLWCRSDLNRSVAFSSANMLAQIKVGHRSFYLLEIMCVSPLEHVPVRSSSSVVRYLKRVHVYAGCPRRFGSIFQPRYAVRPARVRVPGSLHGPVEHLGHGLVRDAGRHHSEGQPDDLVRRLHGPSRRSRRAVIVLTRHLPVTRRDWPSYRALSVILSLVLPSCRSGVAMCDSLLRLCPSTARVGALRLHRVAVPAEAAAAQHVRCDRDHP